MVPIHVDSWSKEIKLTLKREYKDKNKIIFIKSKRILTSFK